MDRREPDPDADDLYARLGLPRTASAKDVKKAFRAAASIYHPDQSEAHRDGRAFRRLCEARDVLSDWLSRRDYDRRSEPSAPPLRAPSAGGTPRSHASRTPRPHGPAAAPSVFDRWEPMFPVIRPWVVLARNAAFALAFVGNAMFLNAALATDPQRLREHWHDLVTWDVLILETLYVAAPITLHLLSMALITSQRSRST